MSSIPHHDPKLYALNVPQLTKIAEQEGAKSLIIEEEGIIYRVGKEMCYSERDALIVAIEKMRKKGGGK